MTRRKWIGVIGGIVVVILLVVLLFPAVQSMIGRRTEAPNAPNFGSTVRVSHARVVLPPSVPGTAAVYFDLANTGSNTVHLTQVAVEHATSVRMADTRTPNSMSLSNVPVAAGQTLSFAPRSRYVLAANYDPNMVPGAKARVTLTFDTSGTLTVAAAVEAGTGPNGTPGPGEARQTGQP